MLIPFPAIVKVVNDFFVPIVTFEILDSMFEFIFKIFIFDEEKQQLLRQTIKEQFSDLGYETHNSVLNLGSTFIITVVYMVAVFVSLVFRYASSRYSFAK